MIASSPGRRKESKQPIRDLSVHSSLMPSASADGCSPDDVIAFEGLRAMTLTLDLGFTGGDLASEITVKAVDDHDQTHSTTFKIMQNLAYYASSGGAEMRDAASAKLAKGIISPDGLHCTDLCGSV